MELYEEKRVVFDDLTHTYELDGKKFLIGVTTLLKKHGLSPWEYASVPEDVLARAACRGTAVHRLLEDYDNGLPVTPYDVRYLEDGALVLSKSDFEKAFRAYKRLGLNVVASEYLVSDDEVVASSIDKVIATDNPDEFILADIKTTSVVHTESVSWQLSIYAYLFERANKGAKVVGLEVIHVRDGKAKVVEIQRRPDECVEALLLAEKEGRIYSDTESGVSLSDIISLTDCVDLVAKSGEISALEETIKTLKADVDALKERIYDYMVAHNIDKLDDPLYGSVTLKRPYERKSLDAKVVESLAPEVYEKALKTTMVKGGITFKA